MNDRAADLCRTLSGKVSLVWDEQLAADWGISSPTGRRHLAAWLGGLVRDDLLRRFRVVAKPPPALDAPLLTIRPGEPIADAGALAWTLEKRWNVEPVVMTVYTRGPRCRRLFGGAARCDIGNLAAVSHDLALASLFFRFVASRPDRARDWTPDWERKGGLEHGEKLPDVLLHGDDGVPFYAIEMGGTYPPRRLTALQKFCSETLRLPLEIW